MSQILVLNGPNLNLLGTREPHLYGSQSLNDIEQLLRKQSEEAGISIDFHQTNAEHELVELIHSAKQVGTQFIIINPAALTHTSVAIRDALLGVEIPFIELHLSNTHARESFRHHSYLSDIATGIIMGFGAQGYEMALDAAICRVNKTT